MLPTRQDQTHGAVTATESTQIQEGACAHHSPSVHRGQVPADPQAQARAVPALQGVAVESSELLGHPRLVFQRDS